MKARSFSVVGGSPVKSRETRRRNSLSAHRPEGSICMRFHLLDTNWSIAPHWTGSFHLKPERSPITVTVVAA